MIKTINLTKSFEDFKALDNLSWTIDSSCVYGLIGSNGAGKSTFLRTITGIYVPDEGEVYIDDKPVYENPEVKKNFVFVPDDLYFLKGATLDRMAKLYSTMYDTFDFTRYNDLVKLFKIDSNKNLSKFSKGMKRQSATILALSCKTQYLFFDETFDGLDPIVRNLVKKVIYDDICDREATAVITSHSLRELEDTCDQLSLLYQGGIVFQRDIQNLKTSLFKIQIAFEELFDKNSFVGIDMLDYSQSGKVATFIVKGNVDETSAICQKLNPVLFEVIPLSLEEVFVHEMDSLGYNFDELSLNSSMEDKDENI